MYCQLHSACLARTPCRWRHFEPLRCHSRCPCRTERTQWHHFDPHTCPLRTDHIRHVLSDWNIYPHRIRYNSARLQCYVRLHHIRRKLTRLLQRLQCLPCPPRKECSYQDPTMPCTCPKRRKYSWRRCFQCSLGYTCRQQQNY